MRALRQLCEGEPDARERVKRRYDDEAAAMRERGVDAIINIYDGVGQSLAEAVEALPDLEAPEPESEAALPT